MVNQSMRKSLFILVVLGLAVSAFPICTSAQNASVSDIVIRRFAKQVFNCIALNADGDGCPGRDFYTFSAFLIALKYYTQFGKLSSIEDSKREIAAAFAHFAHETANFCYIEEIDGQYRDYCDKSKGQYPCNPNKKYYGRGPIQLTWNYNYGPCGQSNGFDGLNYPEIVAINPVISFRTALWYWLLFVRPVINQGFGATIRIINGALECDGKNPSAVQARVKYYVYYCRVLKVTPGNNIYC